MANSNSNFSENKRKAVIISAAAVLAVFLVVMTVFFIVPEIRADKYIKSGNAAFSAGKNEEALSYYKQAQEINPLGKKAQSKIDEVNKAISKKELEDRLAIFHYNYLVRWNSLCTNAQQGFSSASGYDYSASPADQIKEYSNIGNETVTWADYLAEQTVAYLNELNALYDYAVSMGYKLSENESESIDANINQIKEGAKESGISFEEYISKSYGKKVSEAFFRNQMEKEMIVERFSAEWTDSAEKNYSDEEIKEIYEKDKSAYDVADFRIYCFDDYNYGEQAKVYANKIAISAKDEKTFVDYVMKFSAKGTFESRDEADSATYSYGIGKASIEANLNSEAAKWALDSSRKAAETKVFTMTVSDVTYYYVFFVVKPAYQKTVVDVRHIYLRTVDSDYNSYSADKIKEIQATVSEIENLWTKSDKSEEYFAQLASKYTDDPDTVDEGGLVENISVGQMPEEFNEWIFNNARKNGEFTVLKSSYGYHIIYFIDKSDEYTAAVLVDNIEKEFEGLVDKLIGNKPYLDSEANEVITAKNEAVDFIESTYLSGKKS